MQCACPAAFGGVSSGRRPAIFSSPKRSTARGYGLAGISVPGPAYAMSGPGAFSAPLGAASVPMGAVSRGIPTGMVHPPVPFGRWSPGYGAGTPFGDARANVVNKDYAEGASVPGSVLYASANQALVPAGQGGGAKVQGVIDSVMGIFTQVAPVVFGPKPKAQSAQQIVDQSGGAVARSGMPPWLLYTLTGAVVLVGGAVIVKLLKPSRRR